MSLAPLVLAPPRPSAISVRIGILAQDDLYGLIALNNTVADPAHGAPFLDIVAQSRIAGSELGRMYLKTKQDVRAFATLVWHEATRRKYGLPLRHAEVA